MGEWRKVIPEKRDRFQSRVLVWAVGLAMAPFCVLILGLATVRHNAGLLAFKAVGVSLTFGVLVWALRAATPAAAFFGSMICMTVVAGTGSTHRSPVYSGLAPLMALFVLTFASTKAGRRRKEALGLAEARRGRNAAQIVANLGASALVVTFGFYGLLDWIGRPHHLMDFARIALPIGVIAALCEATADTISSEIGQAFGGRPFLLTTLRRVEAGTDGAVSVMGSAAGFAGAAIVAAVGMWAMRLRWQDAAIGLAGGVAGWIFDSVLGATVERRGWLGNDLVNFGSTVVAVAVAFVLFRVL